MAGKNVCGTITDHPDGKRFFGYNINSANRYPKLACNLPAGTYTLSMDVRSIESAPVTYGNIRIWARDATDGIIYDPYISTGTKGQQTAGGVVLGVGSYYGNIPTTFTHVSAIINLGFPVSELIFGCYNSGKYIEYQNLQLEYGSTATDYEPYIGQFISIPLNNNKCCSLPDGTRDTLALSYQGPSTEHEGWGVFRKVLTQRVGHIDDVSTLNMHSFDANNKYISFDVLETGVDTYLSPTVNVLCPNYPGKRTLDRPCCYVTGNGTLIVFGNDDFADRATAEAMLSGVSLNYQLATPTTHNLGAIELPIITEQTNI